MQEASTDTSAYTGLVNNAQVLTPKYRYYIQHFHESDLYYLFPNHQQ